jgi:two-component system chemotaxis response regulator CheY
MPIRIVLIVDNPGDAKWFRIMLDECGFDTVLKTYSGGIEALRALRSNPEADLVVIDWYMPQIDTRDLLDALREIPELALTPVAVFVPEHQREDLLREWRGGRFHLVSKPIDCDQLTAIVRPIGEADQQRHSTAVS